MNKRNYLLTIFVMVALLLTACNKKDDSTEVSTPLPTMTATATPVPTEEPLMPGVVALENVNPLESGAGVDTFVSEALVEQQTTGAENAATKNEVEEEKPAPTADVEAVNPPENTAENEAEEETPAPTADMEEVNPPEKTTNPNVEEEAIVQTPPVSLEEFGHIENSTEYERYNNMSGEEQVAFMESFDSPEAFVAWYNAAEAAFNAETAPIIIGADATLNLGNLTDE